MNTYPFWIGLAIGLVGMAGDFVVPLILGRQYPGYSHVRDTISTLGTTDSPVRHPLSVWLVILGFCFIGFAVGQGSGFDLFTWRHWLYLSGIAAFGVGAGIVAGLFPEDSFGKPETRSGKIHGIGSGAGFILLLLTPLWARDMDEYSAVRGWNTVGFFMALTAFTLFLISGKNSGFLAQWTGLWQRLCLGVIYFVLVMNALIIRAFAA